MNEGGGSGGGLSDADGSFGDDSWGGDGGGSLGDDSWGGDASWEDGFASPDGVDFPPVEDGASDPGSSPNSGDDCPWAAICWDEPAADPDPQSDPQPQSEAPQPQLQSPPDPKPRRQGGFIPGPTNPDAADDDGNAASGGCRIAHGVSGRRRLAPWTPWIDCGAPELIPACTRRAMDGACVNPEIPSTLDAYSRAQDACTRLVEDDTEAWVLEEILYALQVDRGPLGLPEIRARNRRAWDAGNCSEIWSPPY